MKIVVEIFVFLSAYLNDSRLVLNLIDLNFTVDPVWYYVVDLLMPVIGLP